MKSGLIIWLLIIFQIMYYFKLFLVISGYKVPIGIPK